MNNQILVYKERTNSVLVDLGLNITGDTITSEIRVQPFSSSTLIATWTATVTNAVLGLVTLTLDNSVTSAITQSNGYMDIKRVVAGEPIPVFDQPLDVVFIGSVTV
mgnify:CR=1 FL=1